MDFAEFIAPMTVQTFMSDYFGSRPVHIHGEAVRAGMLSTARLEQLLAVLPHWTEDNLKLILNSRPVLGEHFLEKASVSGARRRADPAKVQLFLRIGASLVGDHIEDIDPMVRQAAAMLSDQFAATAGANVYYSFPGIRAFNSHCDLHEVFAVQLEGEKVWQIYENRADAPVEALQGENAQAMIDQAKGKIMMTVHMRPGDLLYIPRGYFHDALADSSPSLHLTFGVRPLDGRYVFRLLEDLAIKNPRFREYLPDGRGKSEGIRAHLARLAEELAGMMGSPLFERLLINEQRALVIRAQGVNMQDRRKLDYYATTGQQAELVWTRDGVILRHSRGEEALGASGEAIEWVINQQAFSLQQLQANFRWLTEEEAQRLVELVTLAGLFAPYEPAL